MYIRLDDKIIESDKIIEGRKYSTNIMYLLNKIIVVSYAHKKVYDKSRLSTLTKTDRNEIYGAIWNGLNLITVAKWDGNNWTLL